MARAIWTGALAFGLVSVPVGLYSATEDKSIRFRQFQEGTSDRIRYRRVNERTGEEVEYGDIVKGHDIGGGDFVVVTGDELEAVEPGRSRTMEVSDFVDLDEIDPIYFRKSYYLAPQGEAAERPYALLRQAMAATNKVAISTLVMRGKQHLVAVRPESDVLVLETMFFADEVRDPAEELPSLPQPESAASREVETAKQLVESMTTSWRPEAHRDTYRERVEDLLERKRQGQAVVSEHRPPESGTVLDLMEALRASVEAARTGRRPGQATETAAGGAAAGAGTGPHEQPDDLTDLTMRDLRQRARELDVSGRSTMKRVELEQAVRAAQAQAAQAQVGEADAAQREAS